jgi:hypothetical protein
MQQSVLSPACRAGAHFDVGIAGQHHQSHALSTSRETSAPARYRALRIRFDPSRRLSAARRNPNPFFLRSTHLRDGTRQSSHKLLTEYQSLRRKRYWGQHLWSREYWVATSGNVTDEVWKKYIDNQKPEEPDDNFKVV